MKKVEMSKSELGRLASRLGASLLAKFGAVWVMRFVGQQATRWAMTRVMTDDYDENLAEFYSASKRVGVQNIIEANLRAEKGAAIARPLGSPRAKRPLKVQTPIIVAAMAYGEALSAKVKVALAKGATLGGAAINGGEGPFLPAERLAARHYILQYNRATWGKALEELVQADAIKI